MPKLPPQDPAVSDALGKRVKALREAAGLSQEKVALAAGISRNHLQVIEKGQSDRSRPKPWNPHLSTLLALSHALGVSLADLTIDIAPPHGDEPPVEAGSAAH